MLIARMKYLSTSELPARQGFPPSTLVALFDPASGETLNLVAKNGADQFASVAQFDEVEVELSFRKLDLASLGGTGRGKAYRLQLVGLTDPKKAS
jgi:hypothetical protein